MFLNIKTISNEKVVSYEVVDPIEYYNFDVDIVSIWRYLIAEIILNIWASKLSQMKRLSIIKF